MESEPADVDAAMAAAANEIEQFVAGKFNEWQLRWYRGVLRKTVGWAAIFLTVFWVAISRADDPEIPPFDPDEHWRVWLTAGGAVLSWITIYCDLYRATPPEREDPKRHLLEGNFNGHFSYLTFYIIFSFTVYWTTCLVAEVAWLWGYTHGEAMPNSRKLLKFVYSGATLVGAMGVTLAILFLKFNWFEPNWRREVLETYHSRGHVWFGPQILFTHLNQTPLSVLDVTLIKNRALLSSHTPEFVVLGAIIGVFGLYYIGSTHVNFFLSGHYPYPFFRKILGTTWSLEIAFVGGIILFFNLMAAIMYALATAQLPTAFFWDV